MTQFLTLSCTSSISPSWFRISFIQTVLITSILTTNQGFINSAICGDNATRWDVGSFSTNYLFTVNNRISYSARFIGDGGSAGTTVSFSNRLIKFKEFRTRYLDISYNPTLTGLIKICYVL